MLGVKLNNRESVHGQMRVVLTPNIGLDLNPNPLRRDLLEKSSEDEL
jgi:hypothetical protein